MARIIALTAILYFSSFAFAQNNWPQFRGPTADNIGQSDKLPSTWSKDKNIAWSVDIPGRGWSSPIVWGNKVFLTAVLNDKVYKSRKGLYIADVFGKVPPGENTCVVMCLDLNTGKVLWNKVAFQGRPQNAIHIKNSYASETPVTDGKRVYAYFGNLGVVCYDMSGRKLWTRMLGNYSTRMNWGTAASPILYNNRLYISHDNQEDSFLTALDADTGSVVWLVRRKEKSNWSTPFLWKNKVRTEIVTVGVGKVRSYNLDGQKLWELTGMSSICIPTPSADNGLLYISSGYVGDFRRRPVMAIKPGATGDISLKSGETKNDYIAWSQRYAGPYHPSPLVYQGRIYVLYDRGLIACYDAKTGKEVYGKKRLPGTAYTASPWAYHGKIFCLSEDGVTIVIEAGDTFRVVGSNELNDEMTLATPAIVGDSLLIRSQKKLYRIRGK